MSIAHNAPQWALSRGEAAVLTALRDTGQADGALWDVQAVAHAAQTTPKLVIARLTTLHRKGYIAPAGVSDEAAVDARRRLGALADRLQEARTRREFTWGDKFRKLIYRLRRGRAPAEVTVRHIGERLGLASDQIEPYVHAAALLQRHVHSRGRRRGRPSASDVVRCSVCTHVIHDAAPRYTEKYPVCDKCAPLRSTAVRRRGLPTHHGGRWLHTKLENLYQGEGTAHGFLAAAARDLGVDEENMRLARWIWDPPKFPHEETLRKLADGITRRSQVLGGSDPPTTPEQIMQQYGWERTWEEEYRARVAARPRPQCPMCGRRLKSHLKTCSFACRTLQRVHAQGFRTDGGRYLFTIMARAIDLPVERIASFVGRPRDMVAAWAQRGQSLTEMIRRELNALRQQRTRNKVPLQETTARALGLSVPSLRRYLDGMYRRSDRKRRVALRYSRRMDLAERLGVTSDEFLALFKLKGSLAEFSQDWGRKSPPRRRLVRGRGRQPTNCLFWREILRRFRWRRKSWSEAADHADELMRKILDHRREDVLRQRSRRHPQHALNDPHVEEATSTPPDELALEPKELRRRFIQHARDCADCRPLAAMDLARAERYTQPKIANLLRCSQYTVHADLARMEQEHLWPYRLSVGEVASMFRVSVSTIRRLASRGRLPVLRHAARGHRFFSPHELPSTLPHTH